MSNELERYRPYSGVREFVEQVQVRARYLLEPSHRLGDGKIEYMPLERQWGGRRYTFLVEGIQETIQSFCVYEIQMRPGFGADFTGLVAWTRQNDEMGVFSLGLLPDVHPWAINRRFRMTEQGFCFREMELWGEELGIVPRREGQYLRDVAEIIGGESRWDNHGWVRNM